MRHVLLDCGLTKAARDAAVAAAGAAFARRHPAAAAGGWWKGLGSEAQFSHLLSSRARPGESMDDARVLREAGCGAWVRGLRPAFDVIAHGACRLPAQVRAAVATRDRWGGAALVMPGLALGATVAPAVGLAGGLGVTVPVGPAGVPVVGRVLDGANSVAAGGAGGAP